VIGLDEIARGGALSERQRAAAGHDCHRRDDGQP
jgi:hypothetical protein